VPGIPSIEFGGNNGIGLPAQKSRIGLNVVAALEYTVIVLGVVGDITHDPRFGVKNNGFTATIEVLIVLIIVPVESVQVPEIIGVFVEVLGKVTIPVPSHWVSETAKVGVTFWVTVTVILVFGAHGCEVIMGVNSYSFVVVLSILSGFQTPEIGEKFVEFAGNKGTSVVPAQIAGMELKVGVSIEFMVTFIVVGVDDTH
jgi:hypothetical protein